MAKPPLSTIWPLLDTMAIVFSRAYMLAPVRLLWRPRSCV